MRIKRLVMMTVIAVLACSGVADAASSSQERGVDNAREAGIIVDPLAAKGMVKMPLGTCPNDPTLPGCPKITEVVYAPELFGLQPDPFAVASSLITGGQCEVRVTSGPYKAVNLAQADYKAMCLSGYNFDVYYKLSRFSKLNSQWEVITANFLSPPVDKKYHYYHRSSTCKDNATRNWRAYIQGWIDIQGKAYTGWHHNDYLLACNFW